MFEFIKEMIGFFLAVGAISIPIWLGLREQFREAREKKFFGS